MVQMFSQLAALGDNFSRFLAILLKSPTKVSRSRSGHRRLIWQLPMEMSRRRENNEKTKKSFGLTDQTISANLIRLRALGNTDATPDVSGSFMTRQQAKTADVDDQCTRNSHHALAAYENPNYRPLSD